MRERFFGRLTSSNHDFGISPLDQQQSANMMNALCSNAISLGTFIKSTSTLCRMAMSMTLGLSSLKSPIRISLGVGRQPLCGFCDHWTIRRPQRGRGTQARHNFCNTLLITMALSCLWFLIKDMSWWFWQDSDYSAPRRWCVYKRPGRWYQHWGGDHPSITFESQILGRSPGSPNSPSDPLWRCDHSTITVLPSVAEHNIATT